MGIRLRVMTTKERLHRLVDDLSEQDAERALAFVESELEDPVIVAFRDAPEDDEPLTAEEEAALAEVAADRAAGVPMISFEEIRRKHGYA
jgi:hypothetical protein